MAKILYAEDDEDLAAMVMQWFKLESHEVDAVQSGSDALEHLEYKQYDIVILDFDLLDLDGVKVCEIFRSTNLQTPVVLMTGSTEQRMKNDGIKAGANKVICKPPDFNLLGACITELVHAVQV